jgi:hypothetical protein
MSTPAPDAVKRLIDHFDQNRDAYLSGSYDESQLRHEFLGPFFEALDWDVYNHQGSAMPYRDVIFEDSLKVGGATKAPDYHEESGPVDQCSSEESAQHLSPVHLTIRPLDHFVSTHFIEGFAVYDCRSRPVRTDKASTARLRAATRGQARIKLLRYGEYVDRWDELCSVFSPEAIRKGKVESEEGEMSKSGHSSFLLSPSPTMPSSPKSRAGAIRSPATALRQVKAKVKAKRETQ